MQISVSGQHISVGSALQQYVKERATQVAQKYFLNLISANVHFSKEGHWMVCDIVVNDGTGRHVILNGRAESDDIYSAFDIAISRIEKQLRKYKSKLKGHHERIKVSEVPFTAVKYTIATAVVKEDLDEEMDENPVIIAEKPVRILTLSVSEAVMQMDLENLPALMFNNSNTNRINIVYYRRDGNIAWIDSK